MKQFWFLLVFCSLVGCSGEPTSTPTPPAGPIISDSVSAIQIAIASDDFVVGTPRIPFVLFDGPNKESNAQKVVIHAFDLLKEAPELSWKGEATNYSDYAIPYWVVYPELPHDGLWGFVADITLADGTLTQSQFTIEVVETSLSPTIGSPVPATQNRTLATEPEIGKLTSSQDPNPALYQMTVDEAVANDKPSVVVFSTPAFCQTAVCAPVLDSVEEVYEVFGDRVNFIHLEIYKEFNPELVVADEVTLWGLISEPWTFVLGEDGHVVARLGGPVSPQELTAVLEEILP